MLVKYVALVQKFLLTSTNVDFYRRLPAKNRSTCATQRLTIKIAGPESNKIAGQQSNTR